MLSLMLVMAACCDCAILYTYNLPSSVSPLQGETKIYAMRSSCCYLVSRVERRLKLFWRVFVGYRYVDAGCSLSLMMMTMWSPFDRRCFARHLLLVVCSVVECRFSLPVRLSRLICSQSRAS